MSRILHVSKQGNDLANGDAEHPLLTVNAAARLALPGDTVMVHAGVYREWVKPINAGVNDVTRITYCAAPGESVVLCGSELVTDWQPRPDGSWKTRLAPGLFVEDDPVRDTLHGDWFMPGKRRHRRADLFVDGVTMYPVDSLEDLEPGREFAPSASEPQRGCWYVDEQADGSLVVILRCDGTDPNQAEVELTTRPAVFMPQASGIDYITVRGFEIRHAATQWAPPTAQQIGAVSPNWSKGWVIEDNHIHHVRCSGISLGRDRSSGNDNEWTTNRVKHGTQRERDVIFKALQRVWSRESVGSHVVRRNHIHHCEQTAVCGHLGCIFSEVVDNEIHHIHVQRAFAGYEIAGIKLHAAIDTLVARNHVYASARGLWLDWQAQGTRVSSNLFHDNDWDDLFIEVTHGPYVVDNNIFLSAHSHRDYAQGGAFVHNLMAGEVSQTRIPDRYTPYHFEHSTAVAGVVTVLGGDHRWYRNVFAAGPDLGRQRDHTGGDENITDPSQLKNRPEPGTAVYNAYPPPGSPWYQGVRQPSQYAELSPPMHVSDNVYYRGAHSYQHERDAVMCTGHDLSPRIEQRNEQWVLHFSATEAHAKTQHAEPLDARKFGASVQSECSYKDYTGLPLVFSKDYLGAARGDAHLPGPFAEAKAGANTVVVWPHPEASKP